MCEHKCEVYARVVGYLRPMDAFNAGKQQEFRDRVYYDVSTLLERKEIVAKN